MDDSPKIAKSRKLKSGLVATHLYPHWQVRVEFPKVSALAKE